MLKNEFEYIFFFLDYTIAVSMPAYFVKQFFPRTLWSNSVHFTYINHRVSCKSSRLVFTRLPLDSFVINNITLSTFFRVPFHSEIILESDTPVTQEDVHTDPDMPGLVDSSSDAADDAF